ncbi:MAG: hypothetical protein Q9187_008755, partial [Circinaria calcarea]
MSSHLSRSYEYLTLHIIPGPNSISYFIPLFLLPLALLIPPSRASQLQLSCIFLPLIYACIIHTWIRGGGIDVISANVALWSTVLIALQDCRGTYRRIHLRTPSPSEAPEAKSPENNPLIYTIKGTSNNSANDDAGTWEEPYPDELYRRLCWVLTLLTSVRLTYWKINDPHHDKTQPPFRLTRPAFLRRAASIILQSYILLDTAAFYSHHDPYFTRADIGIDTPLPLSPTIPPFLSTTLLQHIAPRFLRSSALGAQIYATITLGGALGTSLLVLSNSLHLIPTTWSLHTWPLFFGPVSAVLHRGLRGLWGTWWHQTMRHPTSMPGRALAARLGIPPHSTTAYALRTLSAFFFSGLVHMGLVPPEPLSATRPTAQIRLSVALFFWIQALGVGLEMAVSRL